MAAKKPTAANRDRTALAGGGAIALLLAAAGGAWLLNRPPAVSMGLAASSAAAREPERPSTEQRAEPVATPPSAKPPLGGAQLATPPELLEIDLRKVQLALEGGASPAEAQEAAKMLVICQGADAGAKFVYNLRDQGDATWRELEKRTGVNSERFIATAEETVRRCQVFDSATLARRGELLKRAYEGGAKDSALDYLTWVRAENTQAMDPELLGKLQRDARQSAEDGNFEALVGLSQTFDPSLGVTLVQREAYKEARFLIETEMSGQTVATASRDAMEDFERSMSQWVPTPRALSAEEQQEASALAQRVVAAWHKHRTSGG